jgi:hypothetical protein
MGDLGWVVTRVRCSLYSYDERSGQVAKWNGHGFMVDRGESPMAWVDSVAARRRSDDGKFERIGRGSPGGTPTSPHDQDALVYMKLQDVLAEGRLGRHAHHRRPTRSSPSLFGQHVLPYGEVKLDMTARLSIRTAGPAGSP